MRLAKSFPVCVLAIFLAACGQSGGSAQDDKAKFKGKGKGGGPVPVLTAAAALKSVPIEIQVVGNVEAYSTVSIRAQVSGQLTDVMLKDGDFVHKGDVLFKIDPRVIDGQLAQAEANLARSTAQLAQSQANLARDTAQENYSRGVADRYEQLVKDGIFSQDQGRQTRANADALGQAADQATINNIRLQKSYTTITAPIDGRTGNVTTKLGNLVNANQTELAQIYQVEPIYVTFAVPEGRLPEVKKYFDAGGKLPVVAQAQDGSGQPERGELSFIDNAVDTSTGTIKLKGTFKNSTHTLWPGQFVNVTLQLTTRGGAVTIPNQAVQTGQDGTFVYVVGDDGKVQFRPVKVGPRVDLDLVIDDGLQAGETVVTEGQLRLQPGSQVQVGGGNGRGGRGGKGKDGDAPAEFKGKDGNGDFKGRGGDGDAKGNDGGEFKGRGGKGKGGFKGKRPEGV
jgi:multidrug efflux system membrane fusion protein